MNGWGSRLRVALAAAAVFVMTADLAGWWWWQRVRADAAVNPESSVEALAASGPAAWPPVVQRSRKLPVGEIGTAPRQLLVAALGRLGRLQARWMPVHPAGFTNLARSDLMAGRGADARSRLDHALLCDPTSPQLHRLLAIVLLSRGDVDASLEQLAVAEAIAPGLRTPPVELIAEHERRVRVRGLQLRSTFYPRRRIDNALALARELRADGDGGAAQKLLAELRSEPDVCLELARWALEDGDRSRALNLLESVTSSTVYPRGLRARAWAMVAVVSDLDGNAADALKAAQRALELDPHSPYPYFALAGLAESRGDYEAALDHLRRAWGMSPTDVGLLLRIARVAERAGRPADALLALERAVEIDPGSSNISAQMVSLQIRQGRFAEAAISLSRALDRHPTDPVLLDLADRLRRDVTIR